MNKSNSSTTTTASKTCCPRCFKYCNCTNPWFCEFIKLVIFAFLPWFLMQIFIMNNNNNQVPVWSGIYFKIFYGLILLYYLYNYDRLGKIFVIIAIPLLLCYYCGSMLTFTDNIQFAVFYLAFSWSQLHARSFKIMFFILLPWYLAYKYGIYKKYDLEESLGLPKGAYNITPTSTNVTTLTFMDGNIY